MMLLRLQGVCLSSINPLMVILKPVIAEDPLQWQMGKRQGWSSLALEVLRHQENLL